MNDPQDIRPNFADYAINIDGEVSMDFAVPGVPDTAETDLRLGITRIGGGCNNALPATSPVGLLGLVGLLGATGIWLARRA